MEHKKLIMEIYSKKARNYRRTMENHPGFRELKREIARCVKTEKVLSYLILVQERDTMGRYFEGE
ncbi:MAG: hypothetical protein ACXQTD_08630 [Candidatus Syntropharchaeia archaeon]